LVFPDEEEIVDDDGAYGGELPKMPSLHQEEKVLDTSHIEFLDSDEEFE
jgi:hypothetical protein